MTYFAQKQSQLVIFSNMFKMEIRPSPLSRKWFRCARVQLKWKKMEVLFVVQKENKKIILGSNMFNAYNAIDGTGLCTE